MLARKEGKESLQERRKCDKRSRIREKETINTAKLAAAPEYTDESQKRKNEGGICVPQRNKGGAKGDNSVGPSQKKGNTRSRGCCFSL